MATGSLRLRRAREAHVGHPCQARPVGFSLLEAVVALGLSATLLATLFPVYWQATQGALLAHDESVGAMLAAQKIEQLRALAYSYDEAMGGPVRATDTVTDLSTASPSAGGAGLSPSPASTLLVSTAGYADYLDASGRWVGSGTAVPPGAFFVRRWAITPSLSTPDDAVLLQVMVAPVAREASVGPRNDARRRPGDVWLTLLRSRVM